MARTRVSRSRRRTPRSKSRSRRHVKGSRRVRNTLFNPRVNLNQFKRRRRSAKRRRRRGTRRLRMVKLFGGAKPEEDKDTGNDVVCSEQNKEGCKKHEDICDWNDPKCDDKPKSTE